MPRDINILVVDDEYIIRNWLSLLIEKNREAGLCLVGSVSSGARAIALCREKPVDIVITDVKMSPMNGIELIRTLKPLYPNLSYVIISNYEDFSAAQEGIRLGAFEYFLKAEVEDTDILNCLLRLRQRIIQNEIPHNPTSGEALSTEMIRQQHLLNLIQPNPIHETRNEHLRSAGIDMDEDHLRLVVFALDQNRKDLLLASPEYQVFHQIVTDQLSRMMQNVVSAINTDGNIVVLAQAGNAHSKLDTELDTVLGILRGHLNSSVSVAIGTPFSSFKRCAEQYKNTVSLLEQRFYSDGSIICKPVIEKPCWDDVDVVYHDELLGINRRIGCFEFRSAFNQIEALLGQITLARNISPGDMRHLCTTLLQLFSVSEGIQGNNLDPSPVKDMIHIPLCRDLVAYTLSALEESLHQRIAQLTRTEPVELAVDYIHSNFSENISLSQVAALVHLSESYLSKQFKEKTGENFNTYLSRCRINHAKYLLRNSNAKVGAIGTMVGYPNVSYFTQVFRRLTGQSPDQYRSMTRET